VAVLQTNSVSTTPATPNAIVGCVDSTALLFLSPETIHEFVDTHPFISTFRIQMSPVHKTSAAAIGSVVDCETSHLTMGTDIDHPVSEVVLSKVWLQSERPLRCLVVVETGQQDDEFIVRQEICKKAFAKLFLINSDVDWV